MTQRIQDTYLTNLLQRQINQEAKPNCPFTESCLLHKKNMCPTPQLNSCGEFTSLIIGRCLICQYQNRLKVRTIDGTDLEISRDWLKVTVLKPFFQELPPIICNHCRQQIYNRCPRCDNKGILKIGLKTGWLTLPKELKKIDPFKKLFEELGWVPCDQCCQAQ